jgi:hypothetical protein
MPLEPTIFDQIFDKWDWSEIRHCPGRFIFAEGRSKLSSEEIIGIKIEVYKFRSEKITDETLVVRFDTGGGLISYIKEDDQFLHSLNNEDGFRRKLRQLEIVLPDTEF